MPFKNESDRRNSQQAHRDRNHANLWNLLSQSVCADCKLSDPRVLEFDHLPENTKKFNIGRAVGGSTRSWKSIKEEIDKCDIVCANCHRIRTMDRGKYKRFNSHNALVA